MAAGFELQPGHVLDGRYRVEGRLGQGGMGTVYRAHDLPRDHPVAIKLLSADMADPTDVQRFEREAQLAARVDRVGGVVRVHAFGTVHGFPYCVMELVEGRDLEQALTGEDWTEAQLCELLIQVAETLAACHDEGVVHRDLKPANILLPHDGRPKVADFGLARGGKADRLTATGELVGTPAYMAPELASDGARAIDARVDVYALGAILYQGLTGQPPFKAGSLLAVLSKVMHEEPRPPSELRQVSPGLEAVCLRALAKDPDARYSDMRALAEDLRRCEQGLAPDARRVSAWSGYSARLARREPRALGALIGALVLVVAGVLGGAWLILERSGPERARALLTRYRLYDGQDCAHTKDCPPGEHVLAGYALGLGPGAPPDPADLERFASKLESAQRFLEGSERDELAAGRDRVLAHLAWVRDEPLARSDATSLLARALRELEAGRLAPARAHLEQVAQHPGAPRALDQVWIRVWAATLDAETTPELAAACMARAPESPEAQALLDRAARVWCRDGLRRSLDGATPESIRARFASLGELPRASLEALASAKRKELAMTATEWGRAIRRCSPSEGGKGRTALLDLALRLQAFLEGSPATELGPELSGELAAVFAEACRVGGLARDREAGYWMLALDSVAHQRLGWISAPTKVYLSYVETATLLTDMPAVAVTDLLVGVLRHGALANAGEDYVDQLVDLHRRHDLARRLSAEYGDHPAVRFLAFMRALEEAGDGKQKEPRRSELIAQAEAVLSDEGDSERLAAPYRALLWLEQAELIEELGDDDRALGRDRARKAEVGRRLVRACERALEARPRTLEKLARAYERLAAGLRFQNRHHEVEARLEPGLRFMREAVARRIADRVLEGEIQEARRYELDLMRTITKHTRAPRRWELVAACVEKLEGVARPSKAWRDTVVFGIRTYRTGKRLDEAEALFRRCEDLAYGEPLLTREGVRVARERGDMSLAVERLKRGLALTPSSEDLGELRRELIESGASWDP